MDASLLKLIAIVMGLIFLAIAGISIKIWAKKEGEFAGTCASQNPMINKEGEVCGFCGKAPENCEKEENKNS